MTAASAYDGRKSQLKTSTFKEVKTYIGEEDVEIDPVTAQGKYKTGSYNNGYYTKSYHPKIYHDNYKQHTFGPNKSVPTSQLEIEKEKKINKLTLSEMLGCGHR